MDEALPYNGTNVSYGRVVPLVSSYAAGPLGLLHLPRLWLKGLLHAADMLAEDWGCGPGGLDKRITDCVGIDRDAFLPWLLRSFPTYAECEAWVREHARTLDAESIAASNAMLRSHPLPRGLGPKFRRYLGVDDESVDVGIMLNNLDDWMAVRRYLIEYRDRLEPIVPAISPETTGPLGVVQLPRLWLKEVLRSAGALPAAYRFADEPLDRSILPRLGIDPSEAQRFIASEFPTYVAFESWIRERAPRRDGAFIEEANAELGRDVVEAVQSYDWALLHRTIADRRGSRPAAGHVPTEGIPAFFKTQTGS